MRETDVAGGTGAGSARPTRARASGWDGLDRDLRRMALLQRRAVVARLRRQRGVRRPVLGAGA
ncbi:hypothetical protein [Actinotalea sp. Marseille-Q4924]|uniref:hypothetical protein n=1 Tax=Actinotalea sp. Marseille-Q4924 TaxID=2866571 RepID=UPI001CE3FB22|nr:hypothetical protein [Actinotalea sp. Marseille-Q4924]